MYTDETILAKGKYKFVKLCRVPADYLLKIYHNNSSTDTALLNYVRDNYEKINRRAEGLEEAPPIDFPCEKIVYASEALAKVALKRISNAAQEHKKPVRAYECSVCGGWHLTSIPYDVWQPLNI